jgi:hypothetical protein
MLDSAEGPARCDCTHGIAPSASQGSAVRKLISQMAEILEQIALKSRRSDHFVPVSELRKGAISVVAGRYHVHPNTIADGFIRRLRPQIGSTSDFDSAVYDWLSGRPERLRNALLSHIGDGSDAQKVFRVIDGVPAA